MASAFEKRSRLRRSKRGDRVARRRPLLLEPLEPRLVLDASSLVISELMADNDTTLADEDGDFRDWIEIYNPTSQAVDLDGWYLTDDAAELTKWQFPAVSLAPGEYRVVFASDKDRDDPAGELHTNFKLSGNGDSVALVSPDGTTVAHAYWDFPEQLEDISYGISGLETTFAMLVASGAEGSYHVPTPGEHVVDWTRHDYDDSSWIAPAATGIGFSDNQQQFDDIIRTDVENDMLDVNASLWTRFEFQVDAPLAFDQMTLRMKYDDGFVAYLNSSEVARRNAPEVLADNSAATDSHPDAQAVVYEDIDVSDHLPSLRRGTNVLAIHGLNRSAAEADFLILPELIATSSLGLPQYMVTATPGSVNVAGALGLVEDTKFSVDRGFYDTPQVVEITTDTLGAQIRYTLDGSKPTATTGNVYADPITIDSTTLLRAAAFKPGYLATDVDTQTYVFPADVVQQSDMSSTITQHPDWGPQMQDSLLAIPTISLVTEGAIGQTEIGTSIELIYPDGRSGFQENAGVEHFGGHSLNYPKKSMRISFKGIYGPTRLNHDLFGEGATDEFDQILLKSGSHDTVFYTNTTRGIYIRNRWAFDKQLEMGQPAPRGHYVHLYINGTYWGQYHLLERPNAPFMASYFGGEKEEYDALNAGNPVNGNRAAWDAMLGSVNDYETLQQYMDVVNYADYMLLQFYGGNNWDWNHYQNWMAARKREDGAGYKFFAWDSDMILRRGLNANVINRGGPGNMWGPVSWHPEFKVLLADRAHKYFFNGGILTPDNVLADFQELAGQMELSIIAETARWGANYSYTPTTWQDNIDIVRDQIVAQRTAVVVQQLKDAGFYPDVDAPAFQVDGAPQHGGPVLPGQTVTVSAPAGTIYYTLDGTDPRQIGGAIHPDAMTIASGSTMPILETTVVKTRVFENGEWSALSEAEFIPTIEAAAILVDGVPSTGGQLLAGQAVTVTAPTGDIYYTLDGSDPQLPDGGIHPQAVLAPSGAQIPLAESARVTTRVRLDGNWSELNAAVFLIDTPSGPHHLVVSEINYNPSDPTPAELAINPDWTAGDFEYVELQYLGAEAINLSAVQLAGGVAFDFGPQSTMTIEPGGYLIVAQDPLAFAARYDTAAITVAGPMTGNLDNAGDQVALIGPLGETILNFTYGDSGNWPGRADGRGASLELIDPAAVPPAIPESNLARTAYLEDGDHWRSSDYGGSPGGPGGGPRVDVVINEVLTHTDPPQVDTIELLNTTVAAIDIGGWYLSDSWGSASNPDNGNYQKFRIPDGTIIGGGEFLAFDETDFNSSGGLDPFDFALNGAHGDDVWLMETDVAGNLTRFADHVEFGAAANGESFGRWPNGDGVLYPMLSPTLGGENNGPRVGPIVISEIMYHPSPPTAQDLAVYPALTENDLEFIEIFNPTGDDQPLDNWRIRGGVDFDFAPGTLLLSRRAMVILSFDPDEPDNQGQPVNQERANAFRSHYSLHPSIPLIGGFQGLLDNGGERVQLQRADESPPDEPGFYPHLLEDQALYDDASPWPTEPDGTGSSLTRYSPAEWGHDANSWTAANASPGVHLSIGKPFEVVAFSPTPSGFTARFDREFDATQINLYDLEGGTYGPPDVTVVDGTGRNIPGSLKLGTDDVTFVVTGGPLAADRYTVTLRAAANGFQTQTGQILDGDSDGTPGGDYIAEINTAPASVVFGLPDFSRGPGQTVNVPAMDQGIPLTLVDNRANGSPIEFVDVTISYDPALLTITGAAVDTTALPGATLVADTSVAGQISLSFGSEVTPLPGGATTFLTLTAEVPSAATYGSLHVLSIADLVVTDAQGGLVSATADDAVHMVAYLGDSTGNGEYSALDAQRVARIGVGLDNGFDVFPTTDPVVIADVSGNGAISGLDAQRIALQAVGLSPEEIPQMPQPQRLNNGELRAESGEPEAVVGYQLSVIGYRLSVNNDRLPVISHSSSVISDQLFSGSRLSTLDTRLFLPTPHSAFRIPHSINSHLDFFEEEWNTDAPWRPLPQNLDVIDRVFGNSQW